MGYAPFNRHARQLILRRLLETRKKMRYELITIDELKAIDEIWDNELDLSRRTLVELYFDVMHERLPWDSFKEALLDDETIQIIDTLCQEQGVPPLSAHRFEQVIQR